MAIVTHQNLEPPESEITKQAIAKKELAKLIGWEGVWDEAIAAWQIEPRAYGDRLASVFFVAAGSAFLSFIGSAFNLSLLTQTA
jgi:hypothetical protein